jgi:Lrp/AsnC family leucine-responsive transcriptional regulator
MALEIEKLLDETGWLLLEELQQHARLSYSELGQRVGLSSPAVAERIRKMEEAGIITGYHAEVNLAKLGLPVTAIIRLGSTAGQSCNRVATSVSEIPEVLECNRVTGSDSVIIKVVAASVAHLERIIDRLATYGLPTTSIVLSKPIKRRAITRQMLDQQEEGEDVPSQHEDAVGK